MARLRDDLIDSRNIGQAAGGLGGTLFLPNTQWQHGERTIKLYRN
jgi:hypothetical protein